MNKSTICVLVIIGLLFSAPVAMAIPVDLELILATDTSGSVDATDFTLRRSGMEAAFRDADLIDAIEDGAIGSIAVALWDFGTTTGVSLDWTYISNSAEANAFADAISTSSRFGGGGDGQAELMRQATAAVTADNNFEGTRFVLDIASEGVQSGEGCDFRNPFCQATIDEGQNFLAAGGSAINAIWMNDRDFFGLDPTDAMNAFEYGETSVITGDGSFQVFAETNADFIAAIKDKIIREIQPPPPSVPEPATLFLLGTGLIGLVGLRRKNRH